MKQKIYVTRPIMETGIKLLKEHFDVTIQPEERDLSPEEFAQNIQGYDGILCMLTNTINEELLKNTPSVKVFANYAVGFNNIDVEAADEHSVFITNTPDALTEATAELAFALMLGTARHLVTSDSFTRNNEFIGWDPLGFLGMPLTGKTLGIIGAGRIGQAFGKMSQGFKMPILYHSRTPKKSFEEELGATYCDLTYLLKNSDFVAIHCPYNSSTHHLIGAEELKLMKPTSILINTARGAIIDEKALYETLLGKEIFGAGLDVYEKEPEIYPGLTELDNAIVCPHIGSATFKSREDMSTLAAQGIIDILINKKRPHNCLNKEELKCY